MSTEPERPSDLDPTDSRTSFVYDPVGTPTDWTGERNGVDTFEYNARGAAADTKQPPGTRAAGMPAPPVYLQSFEFRLTASEAQEQCVALGKLPPSEYIVAARCMRTYLTRTVDPGAASSVIGGLEVHAELRDGNLVCSATLSDFGPGDLIVVQVEVAIYA